MQFGKIQGMSLGGFWESVLKININHDIYQGLDDGLDTQGVFLAI